MNQISDEGTVLESLRLATISGAVLFAGLTIGFKAMREDPRLGWAIIVAGSLPLAYVIQQVVRIRLALGLARIEIREQVVPLGWKGTATYVRALKGSASLRAVEARLECAEHVEKGSGRGKRVWNNVVINEPLSPIGAPNPVELRIEIPIAVPAAAPATLHYKQYDIIWRVRVKLVMDGCPNTVSAFRLLVMPAVAP